MSEQSSRSEEVKTRRKIAFSSEDAHELEEAFLNIERIRNMLNPSTLERVKKTVQERKKKEDEELAMQRAMLRNTCQEKLLQDAIQAFYSLEQIRELISSEDFNDFTKKASDRVREEQIQRVIKSRYEKFKSNTKKIEESRRKIDETFLEHRDALSGQGPERKRLRKEGSTE